MNDQLTIQPKRCGNVVGWLPVGRDSATMLAHFLVHKGTMQARSLYFNEKSQPAELDEWHAFLNDMAQLHGGREVVFLPEIPADDLKEIYPFECTGCKCPVPFWPMRCEACSRELICGTGLPVKVLPFDSKLAAWMDQEVIDD